MKKVFTLALAVCVFCACANQKPKEFAGTIVDATMNTVVVEALIEDQTVTFSTDDADMTEAYGLLIGNIVNVTYKGDLQKEITPATKVATDPTYAKVIGSWTEPNPLNVEETQGVEIEIEGDAESINMDSLKYTGWELQGPLDKILLKGQSMGNGETIDFTKEATIVEKDGKLMMEVKDGPIYTKTE
ncbi:MAG: lipocalin family protein [Alistipes sp.]